MVIKYLAGLKGLIGSWQSWRQPCDLLTDKSEERLVTLSAGAGQADVAEDYAHPRYMLPHPLGEVGLSRGKHALPPGLWWRRCGGSTERYDGHGACSSGIPRRVIERKHPGQGQSYPPISPSLPYPVISVEPNRAHKSGRGPSVSQELKLVEQRYQAVLDVLEGPRSAV